DGSGYGPEGRRYPVQRARALEHHQRARVLAQLSNAGVAAVEDACDAGVTRLAVFPDIGRELEGAAALGLAQHDRHGELRIVEVPAELLTGTIEIDVDGGERVVEGVYALDFKRIADEGTERLPVIDCAQG